MELIKGKESLFYIVRGGNEIPVGCLTSNPISETSEMMDVTTRDNQGWRTSVPTLQSYTIPLEGYMTLDGPNSGTNVISYRELRKIKRSRELIIWKIKTLNGWYLDSGKAHISSISFTDPVDDFIGFSATLDGYGNPEETRAEFDVYSDEITYNFTYSHEPVNDANSGDTFLTNLIYNNYFNAFGVIYDCGLKFQLFSIPAKGILVHNTNRRVYTVGDIISYCEKDELVYLPNGFNNDLGVLGNFTETFSYKIIDKEGRIGRLTTHTLIMTDSAASEINTSATINWADDTSAPKMGNLGTINVKIVSLVFDASDPVNTQEWEIFDGTNWVFYKAKNADVEAFDLTQMQNSIRLKAVSQNGEVVYSNQLNYTKTSAANIFITDRVSNIETGVCTYKLHVEGEPFVGYANLIGQKLNLKNARINDTFGGVLYIPNATSPAVTTTVSKAVNIPVGVYDCQIDAMGIKTTFAAESTLDGGISYGFGTDYYAPASSQAQTEVHLIIPVE